MWHFNIVHPNTSFINDFQFRIMDCFVITWKSTPILTPLSEELRGWKMKRNRRTAKVGFRWKALKAYKKPLKDGRLEALQVCNLVFGSGPFFLNRWPQNYWGRYALIRFPIIGWLNYYSFLISRKVWGLFWNTGWPIIHVMKGGSREWCWEHEGQVGPVNGSCGWGWEGHGKRCLVHQLLKAMKVIHWDWDEGFKQSIKGCTLIWPNPNKIGQINQR